jgi:hypothetical protein
MRNLAGVLLVLALLAVFLLPGISQPAQTRLVEDTAAASFGPFPNQTGTPVAALPVMAVMDTPTPTNTPTATITPTSTRTPTPTNTVVATATRTGVPGATGLDGRVLMEKQAYYTHIEWIKFFIQIYNPTGQPIAYTLLGINVWRDEIFDTNLGFHTSWTGAPDYVLSGCWGPTGFTDWNRGPNYRCAPTSAEGWHQDHIGDASNLEIEVPGNYRVEFWACLSGYDQCVHNQNPTWRKLGPDAFFVANPAPAGAHAAAINTPMPQTTCFLITDDPENVYLKCDE